MFEAGASWFRRLRLTGRAWTERGGVDRVWGRVAGLASSCPALANRRELGGGLVCVAAYGNYEELCLTSDAFKLGPPAVPVTALWGGAGFVCEAHARNFVSLTDQNNLSDR